MRGLKRFLYDRRRIIGAFGLFAALNALLLALYRLPVQAALYPTLLCAVLGAIFLGVEYLRVRRTHEALEHLLEMSASMMEDAFPAPEGQLEEDYQALAESLRRETAKLRESMGRRYRESVEYYTLWVHQIKTPISAMRLLLQSEDTPQSRHLRAELSRVERYVEMVLTYLRLDADDTDYVFRTCDLDALIRQAVRRFSGEFIGRKIRLEYAGVHEQLVTDEKGSPLCWSSCFPTRSNIPAREAASGFTWRSRKRSAWRIPASGLRRRISRASLSRATPAPTAVPAGRPAASACICAGGSAASSTSASAPPPGWTRERLSG